MKQKPNDLTSLKTRIDLACSMIQLLSKLCAAIGISVVLIYCSQIGFFPKELSLADGLTFVFVVLSFIFVTSLGILYGGVSILWLFRVFEFIQERHVRRWIANGSDPDSRPNGLRLPAGLRPWPLIMSSCIVFVMLFLTFWHIGKAKPDQVKTLFPFVTGFVVTGFLVLLSFMRPLFDSNEQRRSKRNHSVKAVLWSFLFLLPLVIGSSEQLLATTMKVVGLRHNNVAVELSASNSSRLTSLAKTTGITFVSCTLPEGRILIPQADILWNGVGTRTLMRITGSKPDEVLALEVDNSGVWVLKTHAQLDRQCSA